MPVDLSGEEGLPVENPFLRLQVQLDEFAAKSAAGWRPWRHGWRAPWEGDAIIAE